MSAPSEPAHSKTENTHGVSSYSLLEGGKENRWDVGEEKGRDPLHPLKIRPGIENGECRTGNSISLVNSWLIPPNGRRSHICFFYHICFCLVAQHCSAFRLLSHSLDPLPVPGFSRTFQATSSAHFCVLGFWLRPPPAESPLPMWGLFVSALHPPSTLSVA